MALLLTGLSVVLSLVAAVAAIVAALWARSASQALDGFAALTLPLLARVKQKVDPDPMIASVVAAAAAAPPPAILERAEAPAVAAGLPVIVTDDEDELRESAPLVEPDEHSPTIPMAAPRSGVTRPAPPPVAGAARAGERSRAEAEQDEADARWAGGGAPLVAAPGAVEPPETGPSRSGERVREPGDERAAGCFAAYVVPREPPVSDLLPSSMASEGSGVADAVSERRRRAHELGQATERQRQLDARRKREAEEVARQVGVLSDEEAARPSGEGFAMDRPSWEGRTAVHDQVALQQAMRSPPVAAPIGRIVPGGAARGRGEAPRSAVVAPPAPLPRPSPPPGKPRAKADSAPTLMSEGVVRGPRQRFDPRAEPEGRVEVTGPDRRR